MVSYAVCRIKKIKSWQALNSSNLHTTREQETPNANPLVSNIRLIDIDEQRELATLFKEKIGTQKIRSNAVLGLEVVLSASPQYFRPDNPSVAGLYEQKRLEDFADASKIWLLKQFSENVVRAELHLDEATPHIHAYVVPLNAEGKLSARSLINGRKKLRALQSSFADALNHLDIERGVASTKATYTSISKYYAAVNQDSLNLDLDQILNQAQNSLDTNAFFDRAALINAYQEQIKTILQPSLDIINYQLSDRQRIIQCNQRLESKVLASEFQRKKLESKIDASIALEQQWREKANLLSDAPLEDVAYYLGLNFNQDENCNIVIRDSQFYDIADKIPRCCTCDLVMHVMKYSFEQSIAWLGKHMGESTMEKAAIRYIRTQAREIMHQETIPKFTPPKMDESNWCRVSQHLRVKKKLPQSLINTLHSKYLIYADEHQNVVFAMRSLEGQTMGAYLLNLKNEKIKVFTLSDRAKSWFHLSIGGKISDSIEKVVLLDSPINALSLLTLDKERSVRTLYLVVDDVRSLPLEFLDKSPQIVAVYSNNPMSQKVAKEIKSLLPQTNILIQDSNQQLLMLNSKYKQIRKEQIEYG